MSIPQCVCICIFDMLFFGNPLNTHKNKLMPCIWIKYAHYFIKWIEWMVTFFCYSLKSVIIGNNYGGLFDYNLFFLFIFMSKTCSPLELHVSVKFDNIFNFRYCTCQILYFSLHDITKSELFWERFMFFM